MFCSIINLVTGPLGKEEVVSQFFYVIGGAELLSLLGSRMLIHLKEAAEGEPDIPASYRATSNVSIAEFRTYSRLEVLYWTSMSNRCREGLELDYV